MDEWKRMGRVRERKPATWVTFPEKAAIAAQSVENTRAAMSGNAGAIAVVAASNYSAVGAN